MPVELFGWPTCQMPLTAKHKDTEDILISRDDLEDAWVEKKLCQIVYENRYNRINESVDLIKGN